MGTVGLRSYGQILGLSLGVVAAGCAAEGSSGASASKASALEQGAQCAAGEGGQTLADVVGALDDAYGSAGEDNNYVAIERLEAAGATFAELKAAHPVRDIASPFEFVEAMRTCVFLTEGAYGPHLETDDVAWRLATEWAEKLWTHGSFVGAVRVGGARLIDYEVISSPCAVALSDGKDHTILIQGMGVD